MIGAALVVAFKYGGAFRRTWQQYRAARKRARLRRETFNVVRDIYLDGSFSTDAAVSLLRSLLTQIQHQTDSEILSQ